MPLLTKKRLFWLSAAVLAGVGFYATRIEPGWVGVRYVQMKLPRLPKAFHDYRIAHISDIHMGGWMTRQRLTEVVALINQLRPDLVALTGDFVGGQHISAVKDLAGPLSALRAVDGAVAVLGNHDYCYGSHVVRRVLAETGVVELHNGIRTMQRGDSLLHIAGVDNVSKRQDCLDAVLDRLPEAGAAVLLAHEPDFADISAASGRFDLQLSGHTHGGQIRLPFIGAPMLPSYGRRYPSGKYQIGNMTLYTNRGLGMIPPYVRFNARPEVTIHILEQA